MHRAFPYGGQNVHPKQESRKANPHWSITRVSPAPPGETHLRKAGFSLHYPPLTPEWQELTQPTRLRRFAAPCMQLMPRHSLRAGERRVPLGPHSRSQRGRCHCMGDQPQEGQPQASDGESPSRAVGSVSGLADRALPNTHQLDGQPRTSGRLVNRPLETEPSSPRWTTGAVSPISGRRPGPGLWQPTHKPPMKHCCTQSGSASKPHAKTSLGTAQTRAALCSGRGSPFLHDAPPTTRGHSHGQLRPIVHTPKAGTRL